MELAHRYIDGLASDSEVRQIKERLRTDAKFRKEFMRLQAMKAMLKADERVNNMRGEMSTLFDEVVQPKLNKTAQIKQPTKIISLQRVALAVAATISLLLVATFVFNSSDTNTESLYQAYYSPYASNMLRGEVDVNILYQEALKEYSLKNYDIASQKLSTYIQQIEAGESGSNTSSASSNVEEYEQLYLLLGNCALNQDNTDQAEEYFNKVLNGSNGQFIHDAKWYLALTYLKSGQEGEAKQQLEDIAGVMNIYQIEAKNILVEWGK